MKQKLIQTFFRFRFIALSICLLLLLPLSIMAQKSEVSGSVKDPDTGEPVIGANIQIKGTQTGAITDFEGNFKVLAAPEDVLVISYIGYKDQEITVGNQRIINVALQLDVEELEELVVIGYGTMRKSNVTGAISVVKSKDIAAVKTASVLDALQGKTAGVDISKSSGEAGAGVSINIRGNRSLNASNEPLYIIDGVYMSTNNIDPNEIESIEVLKDASSTAIYGAEGANGVILITTKKHKKGEASHVYFNSYFGVNSPLGKVKRNDRDYYIKHKSDVLKYQLSKTINGKIDYSDPIWREDSLLDLSGTFFGEELVGYKNGTDFDWYDEMFETGTMEDINLGVRGGTDKTSYNLSLSTFNEDGMMREENYRRFNGKLNLETELSKTVKVGSNVIFTNTFKQNGLGGFEYSPLTPPYDQNGELIYMLNPEKNTINPLTGLNDDASKNEKRSDYLSSTLFLEYKPLKGLSAKTMITANRKNNWSGSFSGRYGSVSNQGTGASFNKSSDFDYTWQNIINYEKTIGNHFLSATAVSETRYGTGNSIEVSALGQGLWNSYWYRIQSWETQNIPNTSYSEYSKVSLAGRVNYSYKNKYIFQTTFREDASSVLAEGHKWDRFPAANLAWRLSEEQFIKQIGFISDLKLRYGWGISGNASVGAYSSQGLVNSNPLYYEFEDTAKVFGYRTRTIENQTLRWEKTASNNIGLDFAFLKNRISGSVELYKTLTTGILMDRKLPPTMGVTYTTQNIGEMSNKGIEVSIHTVNIDPHSKGLKWESDITFSKNIEKIEKLQPGVTVDEGNGWFVGSPKDITYDYVFDGIYQFSDSTNPVFIRSGLQYGDIKFKDLDGDSVITAADRQILGQSAPDFFMGVKNTLTYNNFDLNVFVFGRFGNMFRDRVTSDWDPQGIEISPVVDYWTPGNPSNTYPRCNPSQVRSGYNTYPPILYRDGSFLKIKEISIGYTIPKKKLEKVKISSFRVYASANNAIVLYSPYFKLGGVFDPEMRGRATFPNAKTFSAGVNIEF